MAGLNKVQLIGNLGGDPEMRFTANGSAVTNFTVATSRMYKKADGELAEETEWTKVVVWGKQAESCGKFLGKGRRVYVEGRLQTSSWERDGQKHWKTEVIAQDVQFLDRKPEGDGVPAAAGASPIEDPEDLPFE